MTVNLRSVIRPVARALRDRVLPFALPPARADRDLSGDARTIRVVGLLSSATGLGSSARLCVSELANAGYDVERTDLAPLFGKSDAVPFDSEKQPQASPSVAIYHLNPPMLLPGIIGGGLSHYYRTFNIGYWAWELEALPSDWVAALAFLDAVIVPSRFCKDAVLAAMDKPVRVVPHPVREVQDAAAPRCSSPFTVLSVFNFGSSFRRKNPGAAIAAFREAFDDDPEARLILKTSAGRHYPNELADLVRAASESNNVEVIDEVITEDALSALYRTADAYLSLHRSEGFGLTIADAMIHGCPVVTTGWSGNLDFCTPETSLLVPYTLVPFADNDKAYASVQGGRWAEPDVGAAAEHLRSLRAHPQRGRAMAVRARAALMAHIAANDYGSALRALHGSGL